jgi:hypothetical protein
VSWAAHENQKIYDAFSNEWDCCSEFGESSQDDMDYDDDDFPPSVAAGDQALGPETLLADPLIVPATSQPAPAAVDGSFSIAHPAQISFDWHDFETPKLLYEFYGFVAPLPLPT